MDQQPTPPTPLMRLVQVYSDYQHTLVVCPAPADSSLYTLVTFDDAKVTPVHRWYSFKEGFSTQLLPWLGRQGIISAAQRTRLLDPFCGVGTTLLTAQSLETLDSPTVAIGVERNPAIHAIAQAKLRWPLYNPKRIREVLALLAEDCGRGLRTYTIPPLSTFTAVRATGKQAFAKETLQDLLYYREWIRRRCADTPDYEFFMLAWTTIIEQASYTRKDGRALRLLLAGPRDVKALLVNQCQLMLDDVQTLAGVTPTCETRVDAGDARELDYPNNSFTAICYSPPYLNEAWS